MTDTIKIKRSTITATPTSLAAGELAYSENSGNLFIGRVADGVPVVIGGKTEVDKLAGVEAGAQVNDVDSVSGKTGTVTLTLTDLTDVNTATVTNRNVLVADGVDWESRALAEADISDLGSYSTTGHTHTESDITDLGTYIPASEKAANNGVATLDGSGLIPTTQLPGLAITSTFVVANEAAQLALTVQEGDLAVRTDENKTYASLNATNATMADWEELLSPTDAVQSVDGRTGTVTLSDLYAGISHTHTESDITDLQSYLLNITGESIKDLSDVFSTMTPTDGQVLTYDTTNGWQAETNASGVTDFVSLTDTPANYTAAGGFFLKVNTGATAVEFVENIDGGTF